MQLHWPVHGIIDFSVHDHGFKHWAFTHHKLDHSVDEREQIPTRKTQLKQTVSDWPESSALLNVEFMFGGLTFATVASLKDKSVFDEKNCSRPNTAGWTRPAVELEYTEASYTITCRTKEFTAVTWRTRWDVSLIERQQSKCVAWPGINLTQYHYASGPIWNIKVWMLLTVEH